MTKHLRKTTYIVHNLKINRSIHWQRHKKIKYQANVYRCLEDTKIIYMYHKSASVPDNLKLPLQFIVDLILCKSTVMQIHVYKLVNVHHKINS